MSTFEALPELLVRACTLPVQIVLDLSLPEYFQKISELIDAEAELAKASRVLEKKLYETVPTAAPSLRKTLIEAQRELKRMNFSASAVSGNILRSLLDDKAIGSEIEDYLRIAESIRAKLNALEASFETEVSRAMEVLGKSVNDPHVLEGLLLSSKNLFDAVNRKNPDEKTRRQTTRSLVEHLSRASAKTTPRGLLTGVAPAKWSPATSVKSARRGITSRRTEINCHLVADIAKSISEREDLWKCVVPRANPTWYADGGKIYYWVKDDAPPDVIGKTLMRMPDHPSIRAFLDEVAERRFTSAEVIARVMKKFPEGFETEKEANDFFLQICRKGLIFNFLEIPYERPDALGFLSEWIREAKAKSGSPQTRTYLGDVAKTLSGVTAEIKTLDACVPPEKNGDRLTGYVEVNDLIRKQWPEETRDWDSAAENTYVISRPAIDVHLGKNVWNELERGLRACLDLTEALVAERPGDAAVAQRLARHGFTGDGDIPVIKLFESEQKETPQTRTPDPIIEKNWEVFLNAMDGSGPVLDVEKSGILRSMNGLKSRTAESAARVEFLAGSGEDGSPYVVVDDVYENFGGLAGRYSRFLPELAGAVERYYDWHRPVSKNVLRADALVMTQSRLDAAIWHETFQDHAIELFNVRSEKPGEKIIPLNELYVRSKNGRASLVRKSAAGETEVHPCCETVATMNASWILDCFKRLHMSGRRCLNLFVEETLNRRMSGTFCPRVVSGNAVLIRATWFFDDAELKKLPRKTGFENALEWSRWRIANNLPRHVFVRTLGKPKESPFWVDFFNPFHIDVLSSRVRNWNASRVIVTEMLPSPEQMIVNKSGDFFATQFESCVRWRAE